MRLLRNDCRRAIFNRGFLAAAMLVFAMYMQDGIEMLNSGFADVFSLYNLISTIGSLNWLVPCVGVLAYAGGYIKDMDSQSILYIRMRTGMARYCASKATACFISAMLATMLGILIFLFVAYKMCGVFINMDVLHTSYLPSADRISLYSLIRDGRYIQFILLRVMLTGMTSGLWALFGLMLSSLWMNIYVALFAPAIVVYFKDYIYAWLQVQPVIWLKELEWCEFNIPGVIKPLGISVGILTGLSLICGSVFFFRVRRRAQYG